MRLLRIGSRYINFDLVCHVEEDGAQGMNIFFSGENVGGDPLRLDGEDAGSLKRWLRLNGAEVQAPPKSWQHPWAGHAKPNGDRTG